MRSIWENLHNFQAACKFKKRNIERVEENKTNMEVFSVKDKNKKVEKLNKRKKTFIIKVEINNFDLDMQMDTDREVTFLPKNIWEYIAKPTLQKRKFTTQPI